MARRFFFHVPALNYFYSIIFLIMRRKDRLYLFVFMSLFFIACQKDALVSANDYKTLGSSAHELLSSSTYTSLRIEINYMPGYEPDNASLSNLKTFLQNYLNKPDGIQIISNLIASSGKTKLSLGDLVAIEKKNRVEFTAGNTIAVHVLITDGNYIDSNELAISYWNTSFCLFGKAIYANSGSGAQVSRTNLMSILLEHEFGHLLGLVGQGSPQQSPHRDVVNGFHCSNPNCLMYSSVETNPTFNAIPVFDADCIADLKANGAK
jgi:acetyltransferase-like isoleucine patch superfamily enzyme